MIRTLVAHVCKDFPGQHGNTLKPAFAESRNLFRLYGKGNSATEKDWKRENDDSAKQKAPISQQIPCQSSTFWCHTELLNELCCHYAQHRQIYYHNYTMLFFTQCIDTYTK